MFLINRLADNIFPKLINNNPAIYLINTNFLMRVIQFGKVDRFIRDSFVEVLNKIGG